MKKGDLGTCSDCGERKTISYTGTMECMACYKRRYRLDPEIYEADLARSRAWKARNREHTRNYDLAYQADPTTRAACTKCGGPTAMSPGSRDAATLCAGCIRERKEDSWREIQRLWKAGWSLLDIAEQLGISRGHLGVTMHRMRQDGWDLPHRYAMQNGKREAA